MIYLKHYLSVMFDISDVMIDKEEIAMKLQLPIHIPEENEESCVSESVAEEQITVSKNDSCVPESHMKFIIKKVAKLLNTQGIPCCHCQETQYILSPLSACKELYTTFTLDSICPFGNAKYCFELSLSPGDTSPVWPEQTDAVSLKWEGGE